jgi:hypothetical protein
MTPDKRVNKLGEVTEVSEVAYVFPIRGLDNEDYVIGSDLNEKKRSCRQETETIYARGFSVISVTSST